ncbi:MAG TPA: prepilin-type N-terminal cleavage/methylation domain-containing protein [Gemmatimonadales bacterium]|nr:prepilin-type N-terminal cleavage/methylation domain-containing protein [Gemmatimonadales bacterium]
MSRGVTLVELLVVLVLLGLLFAVSGLALASLGVPRDSARVRALEAARARAIRSGVPVSLVESASSVLFLPDGRALGPGVDPLTGAPRATP